MSEFTTAAAPPASTSSVTHGPSALAFASFCHRLSAWRDRLRVLATMPFVASDRQGRRRLLALMRAGGVGGSSAEALSVRVRALGGHAIQLRPGTTDIDVVADDFVFRYQLPPKELRTREPRVIWELGTNIGVGLADLATRYRHAILLGVEPDPGNLVLARRNLAGVGDRCQLIDAAIWEHDGDLVMEGSQQYGLTVRPREEHKDGDKPTVRALSLNSMVESLGPGGSIDFMLMDIEGTEERVLKFNTEWAERVQAIKVELHPETGYSAEDCAVDLQRLGFRTRLEPLWWGGFVIGLR